MKSMKSKTASTRYKETIGIGISYSDYNGRELKKEDSSPGDLSLEVLVPFGNERSEMILRS